MELLTMSVVNFNRYVRQNRMDGPQLAELRRARRRIKNRGYSKNYRSRVAKESGRDLQAHAPVRSMAPCSTAISMSSLRAALRDKCVQ